MNKVNAIHRLSRILMLSVIVSFAGPLLWAEDAPSFVHQGDRIVCIGDSITGHGGNRNLNGYTFLIQEGLEAARPGSHVTVVALGGSGQGVGSWINVEKKSRDTEVFLDVKDVDVKTNLNQPADILIVMLGMNDSLAPNIAPNKAGFDTWQSQYRQLLMALRDRVKPRVIALATITPNTEDPDSPKNLALTEMSRRLILLAKEFNGVVLPTRETVFEVLKQGRTYRPDFHVANDFVHPNGGIGHAAIAIGMLKGLGETAAARVLAEKYLEPGFRAAQGPLPALSYSLSTRELPLDSDRALFEIVYHWTSTNTGSATATLAVPDGWSVQPAELTGSSGTFTVTGKPDHLRNILKLKVVEAGVSKDLDIIIPAPWLIGSGFDNRAVWEKQVYTPGKGILPGEERLSKGQDFGKTPTGWQGAPPKWSKYLASVDYTGGNSPGNVCLFAVSFSPQFAGAFGARWIHSDSELPLTLALGNQTFAGVMGLCAWINGEQVYAGAITSEPSRKAVRNIVLKKGWNSLVFKANHLTWQWQYSLDLVSDTPAHLDALTVSATPPGEAAGSRHP